MYTKIMFCVLRKNISKYYLVQSLETTGKGKGPQQLKVSDAFVLLGKYVLFRRILDYGSSLLSAHLSNLSSLKMLKHMLTVKHMSIISDLNETT